MGMIGGQFGYKLLRRINRGDSSVGCDESAYAGGSKMELLCGPEIWRELEGQTVIDFGCGSGAHAIEMIQHGARRVIGVDIRESALAEARERAERAGIADRCEFVAGTHERADIILSIDAFEHFDDPAEILRIMRGLVKDEGHAFIVFGPTWYHPHGGHLFSVFPWAHLIFTEKALIRWRSDFKHDGATLFREVEGGLNQMTIKRFKRLVKESDFELASFEAVPIRKLRVLVNPLTREFFTSVVRCRLKPQRKREKRSDE